VWKWQKIQSLPRGGTCLNPFIYFFMKKIIVILLFISPLLASAQTDSLQTVIDNYIVENKVVTYSKVYDFPELKLDQIKELAIKQFSSDARLLLQQSSISMQQISGTFSNLSIDFKKFGFKWGNVAVWILHPASGTFVIQFKDGKYRVVVKNIQLNVNPSFKFDFNTDFSTNEGKLSSVNNMGMRRSYYSFGKNMDEMFELKKESNNKDW